VIESSLKTAQIAERLSRSPATIKAYFHDPTGEKARAGSDAHAYCKACHPGAIQPRWDARSCAQRDAHVARPLRSAALGV
jgi:hypothetical protein